MEGKAMTEQHGTALRVALAYHRAWVGKDLEQAMGYVADDIICDAPAGRIEGAEAYRAFMGPFVQMVIGVDLLAAFGDEDHAVVMYDTETVLVQSGPGAEYVKVKDGRIAYSRFVFDRVPFEAARRAAG
jgi:hypothetical protein